MKNKYKIILFSILLMGMGFISSAQSVLDEAYINQIKNNNPEIKAKLQWFEQQRAVLRTSLNPENPTIGYGYFPGNTEAIGVKETFEITQSFEFPGLYMLRRNLAEKKIDLAELEARQSIQSVLLDAQLEYYRIVYLNKVKSELNQRYSHTTHLLQSYQAQFDQGRASILDLNKAKIQALSQQKELILAKQKLQTSLETLNMLNGGQHIVLGDTSYTSQRVIPRDSIATLLLSEHPAWLTASLNMEIAILETRHAKQSWLPEFEAAYESEAVNDEVFRGIKGGISIPLWKDKNKIKAAKANEFYMEVSLESIKNQLISRLSSQVNQLHILKMTMEKYKKTMIEVDNITLLDKALQLGEISVIEYFTELSYYYDIRDEYLSLEYEYYTLLAKHRKFLL